MQKAKRAGAPPLVEDLDERQRQIYEMLPEEGRRLFLEMLPPIEPTPESERQPAGAAAPPPEAAPAPESAAEPPAPARPPAGGRPKREAAAPAVATRPVKAVPAPAVDETEAAPFGRDPKGVPYMPWGARGNGT